MNSESGRTRFLNFKVIVSLSVNYFVVLPKGRPLATVANSSKYKSKK